MMRILGLIFLLLVGSGSLVYGLFFHRVALEETKQRVVSVAVPTMPGLDDALPESHGDAEAAPPEKTPPAEKRSASDEVDPFGSPAANKTPAANSENPFESPPIAPSVSGVKYEKVTEDYTDVHYELEGPIVRDVTIGGVMRLASGHLKRTYSGKPPSLCPT